MAEAAGDDIKQSGAWLLKTKFAGEVSREIRFPSRKEGAGQFGNPALKFERRAKKYSYDQLIVIIEGPIYMNRERLPLITTMFDAVLEKTEEVRTAALNGSLYTKGDENDLYDFLRMMHEVPHMREKWGLIVGVAG